MFLGNTEESVLLRENGKFWKIAHKGKNLAVWSAHVESGGGGRGPVADRAISPGQSIFDAHLISSECKKQQGGGCASAC